MTIKSFFPPKNWQDFEMFIKDLSIEKFNNSFDLYGRSGQNQNGVDIIGNDKKNIIGIQCKHKMISKRTSTSFVTEINKTIIDDEISNANNFIPQLDRFIIATTSFRDVKIQSHFTKINKEREIKSLFPVEIWFWETIEEEINSNINILKKYYDIIVSHLDMEFKEKYILSVIRKSFFRPAFQTPFMVENSGNDFLQAIKDIQELLSTGKLKDTKGNYIAGSMPYISLSSNIDKTQFDYIYELLQQIRDYTTLKISENVIKQCRPDCICVTDHKVAMKLDELRRHTLESLNEILKRNGIDEIRIRF